MGVNFWDVLVVLGIYFGVVELGVEGVGVVIEVGLGVIGLVVGDLVMGLLGVVGLEVVVDVWLVVKLLNWWLLIDVVGVLVVFLMVYYVLCVLV